MSRMEDARRYNARKERDLAEEKAREAATEMADALFRSRTVARREDGLFTVMVRPEFRPKRAERLEKLRERNARLKELGYDRVSWDFHFKTEASKPLARRDADFLCDELRAATGLNFEVVEGFTL